MLTEQDKYITVRSCLQKFRLSQQHHKKTVIVHYEIWRSRHQMYLCIIPQVNSFIPKLWETNLNNTCVEKPCPPRFKHVLLVPFTRFKVCGSAHHQDWYQGFSGCANHLKRRPILLKEEKWVRHGISVCLCHTLLIFLWTVYNSLWCLSLFFVVISI